MNARMDVKRRRRALEPDELRRLIEAARTGETCGGMAGPDRAMKELIAVERAQQELQTEEEHLTRARDEAAEAQREHAAAQSAGDEDGDLAQMR